MYSLKHICCQKINSMIHLTYQVVCGGNMETKDLIIETAFIAFLENGYDRVSLNKIVKNTGLTKGAFYHNFSSKSELLHEVMKKYFFKHLTGTINMIDGSGASFREKLTQIYRNMLNVSIEVGQSQIVEQESFFKLLNECMNMDETLRKMSSNQQEKILKVMKKAVDDAKKAGEIKSDVDSLALAELINVTIKGTMMSNMGLHRDDIEKSLKRNVETILYLIQMD